MSNLTLSKNSSFNSQKRMVPPIKLRDYLQERHTYRENIGIVKIKEMRLLTEVREVQDEVEEKRRNITKSIQNLIEMLGRIKVQLQNKFIEELVEQQKNIQRVYREFFGAKKGKIQVGEVGEFKERALTERIQAKQFSDLTEQASFQTTTHSNSVIEKSSILAIKDLGLESKMEELPVKKSSSILVNGSSSSVLPSSLRAGKFRDTRNNSSFVDKSNTDRDKNEIKVKFR